MRKLGRRSLIAGVLAFSMVLAGTGYAYWTDTLNVTTKATTGDFGVTFADLGLYAQYTNETLDGGWSIVDGVGDGYLEDEFFLRSSSAYNSIAKDGTIDAYKERVKGYNAVDFDAQLVDATPIAKAVGPYTSAKANGSDNIEITVQKMYPGFAQAFRTDVLNVGDIAAKLSNLKFDVAGLDGSDLGNLEDMIGVAVYVQSEQYNPKRTPAEMDVFKLAEAIGTDKMFTVGQVQFVRLSALKNADVAAALENNIVLASPATDNRLDMFIGIAMDPDADGVYTTGMSDKINDNNNDADSQNKGVKLSIDLLWDQFNVGKDAANGNILVKQNGR